MQGAPVAKSRSLGTITEKAQDTIGSALKRFKKFSETVTVPLHEIIEYTDLLASSWIHILAISAISLVITFLAAAKAVEITERIMRRRENA